MATDQTSIAKAAAASISKMSKATLAAAESQKKQNEYIEKFNVLIKERIELEEQDQQLHTSFTEQINNAARDLKENYEGIKRSVIEISKVLLRTISELKSMTSQIEAATIATIQFQKAQKGQLSMFGFLSGKAAGFAMNIGKSVVGAAKSAFGSLGKITSGFSKIATTALDLVSKHPIIFAIVQVIKRLKMLASVVTGIFFGGITVATKFAKTMVGLPLQIVGSAAKIGHSFRKDVVETIGNSVLKLNEFIDTNDGLGASIKKMSTSSAVSLDKFQDVGSDLVKLFGTGAGGLAATIEASGQALVDMGQFADVAGGSIANLDETFVHFYKATKSLGFAGKDIEYITAEAVKNGESIYTALDRVVVAGDATAKQFSLDRKKLSKNFMELRTDITNFGHLSDSQLMQTTAKLTQMGLSMKEASAVFGKIDTFESAAQTSAMLSQTFGMNVDALQLLKAEKPEEIIEQFRDAMLSTGRSFDDLNRHEKSLMATHTGLSEQALKMTMNYRTLGMSYTDIQKKMKEDDPTQQQIKNLKLMSGSLKEIKRTLTGDNMFRNFADGVMNTIKTASGLSPVLLRVSKRFEDFFLSGLKVSKGTKSALVKAFSPFTTVLEKMVGDGKSKKGLLDADKFKGTFEKFAQTTGGFLERAFKGENLAGLQDEIKDSLSNAFDFNNLNQGNSIVGKLINTSGELIGQMLKAFAAFGPGLIDVVDKSLTGVVDFLLGYQSESEGNNSVTGMLKDIFGLNSKDSRAIRETFNKLIDFLVGSTGPFMRLFTWVNSKFLGLASDMAAIAAEAFMKSMPVLNWFTTDYQTNLLKGRNIASKDKTKGSASSILSLANEMAGYENMISKLGGDDEEKLAELTGKMQYLIADLEKSGSKQEKARLIEFFKKTDQTKSDLLDARVAEENVEELMALGKFLKDGSFEGFATSKGNRSLYNDVVMLKGVNKVNDSADTARSNLLGKGGQALLKSTAGGITSTQYAVGDEVIGGKEGGPVVNAIAYAGNAANAVLKGIEFLMSPSNLLPSAHMQTSGPSEITIRLEVDGNTLTEVVLDSDIVGKMTNPIKGRKVLSDGAVVDAAGSRVQSSSMIG